VPIRSWLPLHFLLRFLKPHSLPGLSGHGISPSSKSKQSTGIAPHRYVIHCRVKRAMALLRETELPIAEVAHRVGFASPSHFSVVFHKVSGVTPRQYRTEA